MHIDGHGRPKQKGRQRGRSVYDRENMPPPATPLMLMASVHGPKAREKTGQRDGPSGVCARASVAKV
eukprot:602094-Pleurochrysis_carterae.AAC.3